jgi:Transposase
MAQRHPLGEIGGNRPVGRKLTVNNRAQIGGAIKCGARPCEVRNTIYSTRQPISTTVQRESVRQDNQSLPRCGRPKNTTDRDVYTILRYVRINPKHTYRQIRQSLQILLSTSTIKRILAPFHIRKWQCKKRPELTDEVVEKRRQ